jgi:hypothetical protein
VSVALTGLRSSTYYYILDALSCIVRVVGLYLSFTVSRVRCRPYPLSSFPAPARRSTVVTSQAVSEHLASRTRTSRVGVEQCARGSIDGAKEKR